MFGRLLGVSAEHLQVRRVEAAVSFNGLELGAWRPYTARPTPCRPSQRLVQSARAVRGAR
jgi:hypothetical protein